MDVADHLLHVRVIVVGQVRLGSGADTFNVENGTVVGDISFGAGADALNITGGAAVTGAIRDADGTLAVNVANGTLQSIVDAGAKEILAVPNVDGALVGGASLDADGFFAILEAGAA